MVDATLKPPPILPSQYSRFSRESSFLNLNNLLIKLKIAEELRQMLATC